MLVVDDLVDSSKVSSKLEAFAFRSRRRAEPFPQLLGPLPVLALGMGTAVVSFDWEVALLAPAEEPELIVVGIDCIVG